MKYLASIFLLSLLAANASSQITITESEYIATQNNAATFSPTQSSLPALATLASASGANQTWDFTVATYTPEGTVTIVPYSNSGGLPDESDPDFAASTNVIEVASTYAFHELSSSGDWELGLSTPGPTKSLGYSPPLQTAVFPLTYQATWNGTSATDGSTVPSGFTGATTINAIVDGWGTLITPPSQSNPALRIKKQLIITLSGHGVTISDTEYVYLWLTNGKCGASITTMSSTIAAAGYTNPSVGSVNTEPSRTNDGLSLYLTQNPASNTGTSLSYTLQNGGPVQVELMDALGRDVRMLQNGHASAGQNSISIDPKTLAPGTYFIRVEAPGMSAMRKLVITR